MTLHTSTYLGKKTLVRVSILHGIASRHRCPLAHGLLCCRDGSTGAAALTRRSTSCILVTAKPEQSHQDYLEAVLNKIGGLNA